MTVTKGKSMVCGSAPPTSRAVGAAPRGNRCRSMVFLYNARPDGRL